jgi:flagellin-like hook-associated protein FlgL
VVAGDEQGVTIDLNNDGAVDVSLSPGGPLSADETASFDLTPASWTLSGFPGATVWDTGTALAIDFSGGTTADATIAYSGGRWDENDEITIETAIPDIVSPIGPNRRTVLDILDDLRAALVNNDTEGIAAGLAELDGAQDHLLNTLADVGARLNRVEVREGLIDELELQNQQRLSDIEDADIIEVITKLKNQQAAYQAALQASAMISRISLVDYIR